MLNDCNGMKIAKSAEYIQSIEIEIKIDDFPSHPIFWKNT